MFQFGGDSAQVKFYQNHYGEIFAKLTDGTMIDGAQKNSFLCFLGLVNSLIKEEIIFFKFLLSLFQCREQQATNDIIIIITIIVIIIHQKRTRVQQQPWLIMKLVSSIIKNNNKQFECEKKRKKNSCSQAFFFPRFDKRER